MSSTFPALPEKSRPAVLLEHVSAIDDPRDVRRTSRPLAEVLLLVVCGTIADCDNHDHIAAWGERTWPSCADTCPFATAYPAERRPGLHQRRHRPGRVGHAEPPGDRKPAALDA